MSMSCEVPFFLESVTYLDFDKVVAPNFQIFKRPSFYYGKLHFTLGGKFVGVNTVYMPY